MPLAFWGKRAEANFWDTHWEAVDIETTFTNLEDTFLARVIESFLPKNGKILEGGCGLGHWVLYLRAKGYDIVGIDFAEDTIRRVKECFPNLPVETGNILDLPYPDGYFSAYISLGVMEHFEEGPEEALAEAHRVLQKGGLLLCSIPYFNPLRRIKKKLFKSYHLPKAGEKFYQWAFTKQEIRNIMKNAGFQVHRVIPFDAVKGIKDELPGMRKFYQLLKGNSQKAGARTKTKASKQDSSRLASQVVKSMLKEVLELYLVRNIFGHMVLAIAEKQG